MISIHFEDVDPVDISSLKINDWLNTVVLNENTSLGEVSIVFGSDKWLLEYNIKHLNHDYYTDIITFDYSTKNLVSGDLLISLERVNENAIDLNVSRETELNRVIVHGVLHLCGYTDKSDSDKKIMREKEDYYLSLL